jgi:hypothetical protein
MYNKYSYVQQILHKAPVYYKKYMKTKYKYAATHKMEYKYREDKVQLNKRLNTRRPSASTITAKYKYTKVHRH